MAREQGRKNIAQNKRAHHDFLIGDTYEAGLVLNGTEVKSLRKGRASLADTYAQVQDGQAYLIGLHIPEYFQGSWNNHEPRRTRKLLLHRKELLKLDRELKESGLTLVPLALYFKDGYAKVEIALGKGKKTYDKRQALAERDAQREVTRVMGRRMKGMAG